MKLQATFCEKFFEKPLLVEVMDSCFLKVIKDLEGDDEFMLAKKVTILKNGWRKVYRHLLTDKDFRFISHGDLWMNNVMINQDRSEIKIIDWQTLANDHPVIGQRQLKRPFCNISIGKILMKKSLF